MFRLILRQVSVVGVCSPSASAEGIATFSSVSLQIRLSLHQPAVANGGIPFRRSLSLSVSREVAFDDEKKEAVLVVFLQPDEPLKDGEGEQSAVRITPFDEKGKFIGTFGTELFHGTLSETFEGLQD